MTRKVPVKIRALLALNGKCEKKTRIFFPMPISPRTHSPSVRLRYRQFSSSVANSIFTVAPPRNQIRAGYGNFLFNTRGKSTFIVGL